MKDFKDQPKAETLPELTEEQKQLAKEYIQEDALITQAGQLAFVPNRRERRKKLKWLYKQLEIHKRKRPNVAHDPNVDLENEQVQKNVARMRAWATRYGILIRKINELENATKKNT